MSKGLLIFICVVLIAVFTAAYADLRQEWKAERGKRIAYELFYEASRQEVEYYQDLYYKCLNGR